MEAGKVISANAEQSVKPRSGIAVMAAESFTRLSCVLELIALEPMLASVSGSVSSSRPVPEKAFVPVEVRP